MKYRTALLAALSVAVVAGGSYLLYDWYRDTYLPEPAPTGEAPSLTEEQKEELEVTLPEDLRQDIETNQQRQQNLYRRAVDAHTQGNYDQALERYREAIGYSGQDTIAARSYRYLGDIYARDDSYDQAIRLYRFALEIEPENPNFHYRLGLTYLEKGNLEQAASSLDRAVELGNQSEFYLARGNLHFDQSEYAEAEGLYESGITAGTQLGRLYTNLALSRKEQGKTEGAIDAYSRALQQELTPSLAYEVHLNKGKLHAELEDYKSAISEFETARKLDPTAEAHYNLGLARAENDNPTGAVDAFRSALEEAPEDADIMKDLATAYQRLEDYENAIEFYERALDQRPESSDILIALGRLHERIDQPKTALGYYERLVEKEDRGPELKLTFRRVGELYLRLDQPKNAQPAFRNVLSMDTGDAEVHYNLGVAYRRSDRMDEAIDEFRRARDLDREALDYQLAYADSLYRAGYLEDAQEAYRRVKELDPDHNKADYMIAYLYYQWGDLDRSRKEFQSLVDQLSDEGLLVKTYQNLGNIYLRNGDLSQAETSYRQALAIEKTSETYFNLGLVYSHEGNWDVAPTVFRNALERDAENPRYQAALGLALYQKGLYREAKNYLEQALSGNPADLRNHYNIGKIRETLEEINAEVSQS